MCGKIGKCTGSMVSHWLVVIGALNWGLVGLGGFFDGDWNVVHMIFGSVSWLEWLIYVLVGVAGIMSCLHCKCKVCKGGGSGSCGTGGGCGCGDKKEGSGM